MVTPPAAKRLIRRWQSYTTTHFDMWRIKDGKADEHWDAATLGLPEAPPG
jgi:predicted SnoaL-like aldol condensation-catalyzing enzyme